MNIKVSLVIIFINRHFKNELKLYHNYFLLRNTGNLKRISVNNQIKLKLCKNSECKIKFQSFKNEVNNLHYEEI